MIVELDVRMPDRDDEALADCAATRRRRTTPSPFAKEMTL